MLLFFFVILYQKIYHTGAGVADVVIESLVFFASRSFL